MGVMYLNVLPPLSADGSEELFSQVGMGWRLKVSLRQPVHVGVFLLLHGGFPLSRSFSSSLVPLGAIGFTVFFFLVGDMAKSLWSMKGVILFLKHQACWMFFDCGPVPNHSLVSAPTKALFFSHILELLQLAPSTSVGAMVWATLPLLPWCGRRSFSHPHRDCL